MVLAVARRYVGDTGVRRGRPCLVTMAVPKIGDHWAETSRARVEIGDARRATPAGARAWVAYVWVVISFCAFTWGVFPMGGEMWTSSWTWSLQYRQF